jgi:hypothetical protein
MEPWISFVAWAIVGIGVTLGFSLSMTKIFSSIVVGVVAGGFCLAALGQYNVTGCQYDLTIWDTVRTIVLFASGVLWIVWTAYQVLKDNKQHRCCYVCRRRQDMLPPTKFESVKYDRAEEDETFLAASPDEGDGPNNV